MKAMNIKLSLLVVFLMFLSGVNIIHAQDTPPEPPTGGNNFTIKVFLQGLYIGGETMRQVHEVKEGGAIAPRWGFPVAERFTLELHTPGQYGQVGSTYAVSDINLLENGTAVANLPTEGIFYLTIRTRNHLETVTAVAIDLSTTSSYDFTTSADKAYGNNLAHLGSGVYGIYAGDLNQDGIINASDRSLVQSELLQISQGYLVEDVNGDGSINATDRSLLQSNLLQIIEKVIPPNN